MTRSVFGLMICCLSVPGVWALGSNASMARFSRTVWKQKDGLPQDTIRKIVQTTDGYLWLGTEEGLARFDGYDFTVFNKDNGDLPSNAVTALAAGTDGSLWVGTTAGLVHYSNSKFRKYTTSDGLSVDLISDVYVDHAGMPWIVAGGVLAL